jgi:hypothetical protein
VAGIADLNVFPDASHQLGGVVRGTEEADERRMPLRPTRLGTRARRR